VVELADSDGLKDSLYLRQALGLTGRAGVDVNLQWLDFHKRMTDGLAEGLLNLRPELRAEALDALHPGDIELAKQRPEEYVRLLAGLTGPSKSVELADGTVLRASLLGGKRPVERALEELRNGLALSVNQESRVARLREQAAAEPAFAALPREQQERVLSLADTATARTAELNAKLGLEASGFDAHLLELVRAGALSHLDTSGKTLLENLERLAAQPYPPPLTVEKVLGQTLQDVADPYSIRQGSQGTCTVTSMQFMLALEEPSEYARLVSGLTSLTGRTTLRDGSEVQRQPHYLLPDDSGRADVSRIFQASLMDFANGPEQSHDNFTGTGQHRLPDGTPIGGAGLHDAQWALVLPMLAEPRKVSYPKDPATTQAELEAALAQGPQLVSMDWRAGGHLLTVEGLADGYVYMRNPWGLSEEGSDGSNGPVREKLPHGEPGQMRMALEVFLKNLNSYTVMA